MSVKDNSCGIANLQDKMLSILKHFITVCEKNDLRYWLAGGTCIGALRHEGFIPWDDDLDVYMPRADYEKLWEIIGNGKVSDHFVLCRTTQGKNYHHRVMQMTDISTTFIHSRSMNEDIEHGIYIDIIPLDACPNSFFRRLLQIIDSILFSVFNIQQKPEYNGGKLTGVIGFVTKILLRIVKNEDKRYLIWTKAEKRMSGYEWEKAKEIKCLASTFHEVINPFPIEWFGERTIKFEDIIAVIPCQAELYCEAMYGDYMLLPPKEKQVVRHHTEFIDLDKPYIEYKGIYYQNNAKDYT